MTEEDVKIILGILEKKYGLDCLDQVEFIMEYERLSGNKIPDEWLGTTGRMHTVRLK